MHIAVTYDGGTTLKVYVNGVLRATKTLSGVLDTPSGTNIEIGTWPLATSNFGGLIDEVKIYNTAHTSEEIQAQYDKENNGPVSLWAAEGDAQDLLDGNDGTLVGGTSFAGGMLGRAFSFDGLDDHVVVPDSDNLNAANGITVEAWVYLTGKQGQNRDIISKDGELTQRQFILTASNLDRFRAHVGVTGGLQFFDGQVPVQLNRWYHVAMTYDGASLKLYVDGKLDGSIPVSGPIVATTEPVRIGGGAPVGRAPLHFPGLIDEVQIFNRALSDCQIAVNALVSCVPADTTAPDVTVPADITKEATTAAGAAVSFSASANDDVDGPITPVTCSPASGSTFPLGTTEVTCSATDNAGNTGLAYFDVTVEDTTDPAINSVSASSGTLWPPNHKMRSVSVSVVAEDAVDSDMACKILSVSGDDGATASDWDITGDLTVDLRAERSGKGDGRVYTITVESTDDSGNSSQSIVEVKVPHDQGKKK